MLVFIYKIVINKIDQNFILKNAFKNFADNESKTYKTIVFSA